ncbi:glycine cleavage system aminomethyltransferase GcvT [Marinicellulosiphila megalodicopiae]|uniref:glycine cleavage system aminomethyltransferase GcvT n=1 Tax=Marinicellulosiphila megalodicopiae TaxID=2724896 RepID=UPI003BAF1FCE
MGFQTALFAAHVAANAKLVDFGGWDMPIHYGSQLKEHEIVRTDAGMFDVSHMTVVDVAGPQAKTFLQRLLANDVDKLKTTGKALYSGMLNADGGVIDDLIVYLLEDMYRVVVNCSTREKDLAWMQQIGKKFDVSITERPELAMIAVQGPKAIELTEKVMKCNALELSVFQGAFLNDARFADCFVARTGYTGEEGYEIMVHQDNAESMWNALLEVGVKPCGLGARDTLRLEAGMNLYGNDMDETISPMAANMAWTIAAKDERNFVGKEAVLEEKESQQQGKLIGLLLDGKGVMRSHQSVVGENGDVVGEVTSGTFSPSLQNSIAMARVTGKLQSTYQIDMRGRLVNAKRVTMPFVRNGQSIYKLTEES